MTYDEALDQLKRGRRVTRSGKTYKLFRDGPHDVTNEEEQPRIFFTDDDRGATDWEMINDA